MSRCHCRFLLSNTITHARSGPNLNPLFSSGFLSIFRIMLKTAIKICHHARDNPELEQVCEQPIANAGKHGDILIRFPYKSRKILLTNARLSPIIRVMRFRLSAETLNDPKTIARYLLKRAVRRGWILKRPCESCGSSESEAHHVNYSQPYNVHWLCYKHHGWADRLMRRGLPYLRAFCPPKRVTDKYRKWSIQKPNNDTVRKTD